MSRRYLGCQTFSPQAGSPRANSRFCHLKRLLAIKLTISIKLSEIKSKTLVFYPGKAINIILLYNEATYKKNVSWTEFDVIKCKFPWVESTKMKIIWRTTCILLSCLLDFKCQTDKLEKKMTSCSVRSKHFFLLKSSYEYQIYHSMKDWKEIELI